MQEESEGQVHFKFFLLTRPVTLIKNTTSPHKSCFKSKHSTFLGVSVKLIQSNATLT